MSLDHQQQYQQEVLFLSCLPDVVFYKILCFVDNPHHTSVVVAQQITPLCKAARSYTECDSLWESILGGFYNSNSDSNNSSDTSSSASASASAKANAYRARTQRRSSKRLRRTTAKEDCIHAFLNLRDQTEMCLQEVADMAISKTPHPLTLARLRSSIHNYGPILNINQRSAIGGTLLVDCCRARCIRESVILACVRELVCVYGACPMIPATEGAMHQRVKVKVKVTAPVPTPAPAPSATNMTRSTTTSNTATKSNNNDENDKNNNKKKQESQRYGNTLPALVVASARGMPSVVQFLLDRNPRLRNEYGTSRFRLFKNSRKSISGTYTPSEFATGMMEAEMEYGASKRELKALEQCIRLLREEGKKEEEGAA
uniref:F-box domain-containing protein n=1 Tax=Chaetoceros debilis TaxID=122233 RepID=A0A7S3VCE0_9STRA